MAYTQKLYNAYKTIDGVEYFRVGTVAEILGKSRQMIQLWDSWSDDQEKEGHPRLIPQSTRIGSNKIRCWTEEQIHLIDAFNKTVKYGDLAKYSRTRWGERGNNLKQDRSIEGKKARLDYRKNVNKLAKLQQKQLKVQLIKSARKSMLTTVRKRAQAVYDSVNYDKQI